MQRIAPHLDSEVKKRLCWLNHLDDVPCQYRDLLGRLLYALKQHWRERRLGLVASASAAELQLIASAWIDASERDASIRELAPLGSFALDILEAEPYHPANLA